MINHPDQIKRFINKLVRIRAGMVKRGVSYRHPYCISTAMEKVSNYSNMEPSPTIRGWCLFIIRNEHSICLLIPDNGQRALSDEFYQIKEFAIDYITKNPVKNENCATITRGGQVGHR